MRRPRSKQGKLAGGYLLARSQSKLNEDVLGRSQEHRRVGLSYIRCDCGRLCVLTGARNSDLRLSELPGRGKTRRYETDTFELPFRL
jgi:hypothetical protein